MTTTLRSLALLAFILGGMPVSSAPAAPLPLPSLAPVIKLAGPAVVNIAARGTQQTQSNPYYDDPFFRRFFGVSPPREREVTSQGSGVIVDAGKGFIVTNHHVVEGATEIRVTLQDERSFAAKLVGSDERTDLAVIKIEGSNLKALPLADSDKLEVGDFVIAIGNPFGLDHTLTTGIVSALGRTIQSVADTPIDDAIQTDAAINPGNSGGPLLDSSGRLIGVNTAIYSPSGASAGIGFAVPVDVVNRIVPQLVAHGRVIRPRLGIGMDEALSAAVTRRLGVEGVLIRDVDEGSGAAAAGLRSTRLSRGTVVPGDIIQEIDGKPVRSQNDLLSRLGAYQAGDTVSLTVWSEGRTRKVSVRLQPAELGSGRSRER
jgi:Do/DeqQ family serine protease